jgi:SAM-dependent methyltransferase
MIQCNICSEQISQPLFASPGKSITSLCEILPGKTEVHYCPACGHLQTLTIENIDDYYDTGYKILIDSEEEDQLYKVSGDKKIFRFDHQVNTLLEKMKIPEGSSILDFGCAKATTLKKLIAKRDDLDAYVFDVSEMYVPFWDRFIQKQNQATYKTPESWSGKFDFITSYFVMEHVAQPRQMVEHIHSLLRPGGAFYFIVPNVSTNIADFVVADHVNHFSRCSLQKLFSEALFSEVTIDDQSHDGAFIVTAKKAAAGTAITCMFSELSAYGEKAASMAAFWNTISQKIISFEKDHAGFATAAIYGSGFYGTYISTCLRDFNKVKYFVDNNPYRQGKEFLGRPVISPAQAGADVEIVYVGLNPNFARHTIEAIPEWESRTYKYCFL